MTLDLKPSIKSTFYSLDQIDEGLITENFLEAVLNYVTKLIRYFSFRWIHNIKSLQGYFFEFYTPIINKVPKSISDLHRMHNFEKNGRKTFKIANLYKSNIATSQTAQHPILPDYQMICSRNIPRYKDIPFEHLDYKFDIYKRETKDTEFNDHTYVHYYDYKLNMMKQISRTQFLEKKKAKKKLTSSPIENESKNQQKRPGRPKKIHNKMGRSIICKVTPDDNLYLKLSEVNIL